ncbi:unnamed protein product [Vitrella brassicaformis CCMP3155]|uniref:Uncharacterized protein n=1 Tax=Vitrella brassicaformis (strain CCMP3155) TaxID=1169540 RepID=A0A0G4GT21_VITBC|nr:unnamed protein product [Vitrella brassicaformis CCMP3155]|eukprot:CEM33869.1 unnamed protein product [Vitrella brassicaformis CCMP3155]
MNDDEDRCLHLIFDVFSHLPPRIPTGPTTHQDRPHIKTDQCPADATVASLQSALSDALTGRHFVGLHDLAEDEEPMANVEEQFIDEGGDDPSVAVPTVAASSSGVIDLPAAASAADGTGSNGSTAIVKKRLPHPKRPAKAIDAVVKVVKDADIRLLGPGLQREADRMRQVEGNPLFLQLLFEDADATRCPRSVRQHTQYDTRNEEFVEQRDLLLDTKDEKGEYTRRAEYNVGVIADRYSGRTAEERAAVAQDLWSSNVILKWSALRSASPQQPADVGRSVTFIDLANTVKVESTTSTPPPFLDPATSALTPLRLARRLAADQAPEGTPGFRPPESVLLNIAVKQEAENEDDSDLIAASELKRLLRADGILVGEGEEEAVWRGSLRPALESYSQVLWKETLAVLEWQDHMDQFVAPEGRPLSSGRPCCPLAANFSRLEEME